MSNATYLEDAINDDTSEIEKEGKTWEVVYVSIVLVLAFSALISDKIGADMVMISALTMCMASNIISIDEGLAGFSNEGLLTVLALFVVAAGINNTGGLDWYMNKLLGRPRSIALAQIRLMIPIAIISAFLNNTPVVVVMIRKSKVHTILSLALDTISLKNAQLTKYTIILFLQQSFKDGQRI